MAKIFLRISGKSYTARQENAGLVALTMHSLWIKYWDRWTRHEFESTLLSDLGCKQIDRAMLLHEVGFIIINPAYKKMRVLINTSSHLFTRKMNELPAWAHEWLYGDNAFFALVDKLSDEEQSLTSDAAIDLRRVCERVRASSLEFEQGESASSCSPEILPSFEWTMRIAINRRDDRYEDSIDNALDLLKGLVQDYPPFTHFSFAEFEITFRKESITGGFFRGLIVFHGEIKSWEYKEDTCP